MFANDCKFLRGGGLFLVRTGYFCAKNILLDSRTRIVEAPSPGTRFRSNRSAAVLSSCHLTMPLAKDWRCFMVPWRRGFHNYAVG